jgi:hypothetical protein
VRSGSRRRFLELFASASRCSIFELVYPVVVNELSPRLVCLQPEKADVGIGHDRVPGSCTGIEAATA